MDDNRAKERETGRPGGLGRQPLGVDSKGGSWAAVARGPANQGRWTRHQISEGELGALKTCFTEVLEIPEERLEKTRMEWRSTSVFMQSVGRKVPAEWVGRELRRMGNLDYNVEVVTMADDVLAVRFACEEDREAMLVRGPCLVAGQLLTMERWKPNFIPGSGGSGRVVVWLRLPRLPLDFWAKETLIQIAATAGRPLALDAATDQGRKRGFARIKVELDIRTPLKPGIFMKGAKEGLERKI
ncbi:uncharacterized protein LOC120107600 [Phoenix dactylifera]|uniref:Uncharacterized protein LOC120107600 n=1 Tax=Phoenix dactylifera TaxID=42345 RepID=A0A8B8ZZ89_PHODC|nr:uncharacterized protein LOC120107600 [Phoenix dactylifera]